MNDDADLLRHYAKEGSDAAFTELVYRYVDLVYGAAMRRTGGDAQLSADVAQGVFIALARHARTLSPDTVLGAWLHTATRNAALKLMISEQRRRAREIEAVRLQETDGALDWEKLRPLLDGEIDELPEADRTSLVLRFFERKPFAEIGDVLRISEDAARMRTERAMEKLRVALSRHGIVSTATALAATVSAQAFVSAPASLASTLAAQSLAVVGAGAVSVTLATFMTAKFIIPAALAALAAFVGGTYYGRSETPPSPPSLSSRTLQLTSEMAKLRSDNQTLRSENEGLNARLAQTQAANADLETRASAAVHAVETRPSGAGKSLTIGLERYEVQQAVLSNLRQIAAARDQYIKEKGSAPADVSALVGRGLYIKTVRTVSGEDYAGLAMSAGGVLSVTTPDGILVTFDPSGATTTKPEIPPEVVRLKELQQRIEPVVNKAVAAYMAANSGKPPPNERSLLPYFASPQDGADFLEFVDAQKAVGGR